MVDDAWSSGPPAETPTRKRVVVSAGGPDDSVFLGNAMPHEQTDIHSDEKNSALFAERTHNIHDVGIPTLRTAFTEPYVASTRRIYLGCSEHN